jgi:hypothetical protein
MNLRYILTPSGARAEEIDRINRLSHTPGWYEDDVRSFNFRKDWRGKALRLQARRRFKIKHHMV